MDAMRLTHLSTLTRCDRSVLACPAACSRCSRGEGESNQRHNDSAVSSKCNQPMLPFNHPEHCQQQAIKPAQKRSRIFFDTSTLLSAQKTPMHSTVSQTKTHAPNKRSLVPFLAMFCNRPGALGLTALAKMQPHQLAPCSPPHAAPAPSQPWATRCAAPSPHLRGRAGRGDGMRGLRRPALRGWKAGRLQAADCAGRAPVWQQ